MLDERTLKLLNIINGICHGSGYKIFALSELAFSMPKRFMVDEDEVRKSLKTLSEKEYISVKYEDQAEVCLAVLSKGRLVCEKDIDAEIQSKKNNNRSFFSAFLGASLGGIATALVIFVLFLIFGGK
jgi:hypothetical protein